MASDGFRFPPPYSGQNFPRESAPHFMTSEGMLMPSHMQPPPMYGPRGATIAPKFLGSYAKNVQPRKSDFYCESCDRSFKSQTDLDSHKSEHQRCGIDGCSFVGHPLIVTKHIEQQHSSGLYDKLKNLSTPEDIAKWREERKKRYPSRANVELRQQIQEEKQKRGERLEDRKSRFGQKDDRRKAPNGEEPRTRNTKNQRKRRRKYENSNRAIEKTAAIVDEEDNASDSKIMKFEGTSGLTAYERPKAKKTVKNALTSLVGMYGSDDDSTSEDESEMVSKSPSTEDTSSKKSSDEIMSQPLHKEIIEKANKSDEKDDIVLAKALPEDEDLPFAEPSDDDEENQQEEVPFEKVVERFPETEEQSVPETEEQSVPDDTKLNLSKKRVRIRRKPEGTCPPKPTSALNYSKLYRRRQNTMLEKLLQPDIIHERNILLQCVRYVVQKNFFGVGQPKENT